MILFKHKLIADNFNVKSQVYSWKAEKPWVAYFNEIQAVDCAEI